MALLAAVLCGSVQEGEVDRILYRFEQRRAEVRDEEQFRRLAEEVRTELDRLARERPGAPEAARAAFHAAQACLWAGRPKEAEERLRRLPEDHPASDRLPDARFLRGEILFRLEEEAAARAAFEEFARLHPRDERAGTARLYAAVTLQFEERHEEAAAALREIHKDFAGRPESWDALLQLAFVRHLQERRSEAREILERVIREGPDGRPRETARRRLTEYLRLGEPAPVGRARDKLDNEFGLEDHRGKVVVVYFFDSAFREAVPEAESVRRAWERFRDRDLRILGVSISRDRRDFEIFRDAVRPGWTLFYDGEGFDGKIARLFGVHGLPALWVIDRKGRFRFHNVAQRDLRNVLGRLLDEKD